MQKSMYHKFMLFLFHVLFLLVRTSSMAPSTKPISNIEAQFRLAKFGYMPSNEAEIKKIKKGRSVIDPSSLKKAVTSYQKRFNLRQSGELDQATLKSMSRARCGMPDQGRSAGSGVKWNKAELKYKISPDWTASGLGDYEVNDALTAGFAYWSKVTNLDFLQVFDDEKPDIIIEFRNGEHGDGYLNSFDGPDGTLGHAYFPEDGRIHFDSEETFTEGSDAGYNLRIVAAHEIGHALGLDHSYNNDALMAPYYAGYVDKSLPLLHEEDITNIQNIYGVRLDTTTTTTTTTVAPPIVTQRPWVRPTVAPGKLDYCKGEFEISSAYMGKDGAIYIIIPYGGEDWIFRNDLERSSLSSNYPRKFTRLFEYDQKGIEAMAWYKSARSYYFFKGDDIFRYDPYGYYRQVIKNPKGAPMAAFLDKDNTFYTIYSGNTIWKFNPWEFTFADQVPLSKLFEGLPDGITAAAENYPYASDRTFIYFFKGNEYWKVNTKSRKVETSSGSVSRDFLGCR